jgi:hypothetical protein
MVGAVATSVGSYGRRIIKGHGFPYQNLCGL